jgi:hypothetical protein
MSQFQPNLRSLHACVELIENATKEYGFDKNREIVTSKDDLMLTLREKLKTKNVPDGFTKWQLPVFFETPTQLFISVGSPNVKVPPHSHEEGPGIRFIATGSIIYAGKELTSGDWMYIPKGKPYSFDVGPYGVSMFYCYSCCCA